MNLDFQKHTKKLIKREMYTYYEKSVDNYIDSNYIFEYYNVERLFKRIANNDKWKKYCR